MTRPVPQPGILDIEPYVGGISKLSGIDNPIKLSSNENPLGPSEVALEAFRRASFDLHRYPDGNHVSLRCAIGDVHGLNADKIICGVGSDEILTMVCHAFAGPGDEVIYSRHGFSLYPILARSVGAKPVSVAEDSRQTDIDGILDSVTKQTKVILVANPNNPTGSFLNHSEIERLCAGVRSDIVVVLDGAYVEYVEGYDGGAALVDRYPNLVMTRTFSKIYGLGGLRVGWGYASDEVIDILNRIRPPFNLSSVALNVAEAAVRDQGYVDHCRAENARCRAILAQGLTNIGMAFDPSYANFILARLADAQEARAAYEYLLERGLIVRQAGSSNLPESLRISVGDEGACRQVIHALSGWQEASR